MFNSTIIAIIATANFVEAQDEAFLGRLAAWRSGGPSALAASSVSVVSQLVKSTTSTPSTNPASSEDSDLTTEDPSMTTENSDLITDDSTLIVTDDTGAASVSVSDGGRRRRMLSVVGCDETSPLAIKASDDASIPDSSFGVVNKTIGGVGIEDFDSTTEDPLMTTEGSDMTTEDSSVIVTVSPVVANIASLVDFTR
eukprot:GHVH01013470.1.p1 GENE.GHVH01013470.1~~GHVH01013470.1.p1  ORF type:complete len:197 (+),score=37.75 GHVH01013470.1:82-672(+)